MLRFRSSVVIVSMLFAFACFALSQAPPLQPSLPGKASLDAALVGANNGDSQAQLTAGKIYYRGLKANQNHAEACKWFAAASNQGVAEATAWLGSCYLYGRGVAQDAAKGATLIQTAAQSGDPVGLTFLGILYEGGGIQDAAHPHAVFAPDYAKAADLFSQAVAKGSPGAYARLGSLYLRGLGVHKDVRQAVSLFRQGARLNDPWSQLHLAQLAFSGVISADGTVRPHFSHVPNMKLAIYMFNRSAAQGNPIAALKLGEIYESGLQTAPDLGKATSYYQLAATEGHVKAQLALGRLNEATGTPENAVTAYAWYSLAALQGNVQAQGHLDGLRSRLTAAQTQQGDALLTKWKAAHYCHGCN